MSVQLFRFISFSRTVRFPARMEISDIFGRRENSGKIASRNCAC